MKKLLIAFLFISSISAFAQDDLLKDLEENIEDDKKVSSVFKGLKIINMESTKLAADKDFYFLISHRFGTLNSGIKDLFGLDNANIRFSFVYGLSDWFNIGLSRSSASKIYDAHVKYRLIQQEEGKFPFTVVGFNSVEYNTGMDEVNFPLIESKHRYAYTSQLLISRKFDDNFSFQFAPVFLHENFVENDLQENFQFLLGLGGRYKISKRVTINFEYHAHMNRVAQSKFRNPLSLGVDIETGGHVFQLHVTNSRFMNEAGYLARTVGDWGNGDIFFGFNIWRVF
jgi:hypothetical protein